MAAIDRLNGLGPIDTGSADSSRKVNTESRAEAGTFELPADNGGVIYEPGTAPEKKKTLSQVKEEIAREEAEAARQNIHSRFDGPGVEVELSQEAVAAAEQQKTGQRTIFDAVREVFDSIKNFFRAFWTGESTASGESRENTAAAGNGGNADGAGDITAAAGSRENIAAEGYTASAASAFGDNAAGTVSGISAYGEAENAGSVTAGGASGTGYGEKTEKEFAQAVAISNKRDNIQESAAAFLTDYGGKHLAKNSDLLTQYDRTGRIVKPSATDRRRILQGEGKVRKY